MRWARTISDQSPIPPSPWVATEGSDDVKVGPSPSQRRWNMKYGM